MSDSPVDIGQEFKNKRLALNTTSDKAAKDTKISKSYLLAMEAGEFDRIPNEIVAKGFLQIYSEYLGLDPKHILAEFKKITKTRNPAPQTGTSQETGEVSKGSYYKNTVTTAIALLLAIFLSWGLLALYNSAKPPGHKKNKASAGISSGLSIKVEISDKTWMRALADGEQVFEGMFFAGSAKNIEAEESVVIKIGNAAAVKVFSGGKLLYGGGAPGQVITKEFSK